MIEDSVHSHQRGSYEEQRRQADRLEHVACHSWCSRANAHPGEVADADNGSCFTGIHDARCKGLAYRLGEHEYESKNNKEKRC